MDQERVRPALASTGDPRVDEAIAGIAALDELGLDERPAVLETVHERLRELLGELDEAGRSSVPGEPGRRGEQVELGHPHGQNAPYGQHAPHGENAPYGQHGGARR